ncbi:hypothetical protein KO488_13330 [Poseidonibacter lekithochrous]|uniref:hypothetical protein n=1 Tax=Poseidonibacter TaxID=2321187 RepID=UPI001C083877|nr:MULTISPECIES: hypothetical protein [Poseidonibacter]MBU3015746.1 hypothetical protein [Poseidonibacter lekithochrous]MDO6829046.1 hypothetical protein [Poseidonibacter sp. 1_MG-2023]
MNFYTFNSKNKYVMSIIISFFIFILLIDFVLYFYISNKTNKSTYIEEKISRAKHMKLNIDNQKDYIFIGSSRVKYHINSEIFNNKNIDIFNFGVSGRELIDFPYMVNKAIDENPKNIVLNFSIDKLFKDSKLGDYQQITYTDIHYLFKTKQDSEIIKNAFLSYVKNLHLISAYSVTINEKIQMFYNKFNIQKKSNVILTEKKIKNIKPNCKVLKTYSTKQGLVSNCTNGEGVMYGINFNAEDKNIVLNQINETHINLINSLIKEINSKNINIIIIFDPTYNKSFSYDLDKLKSLIKSKNIIDLTNYKIEKKYWANQSHLNIYGRDVYSEYLSDYFRNNFNSK